MWEQQSNGKWKYKLSDGTYVIGWKLIDKETYFFNSNGELVENKPKVSLYEPAKYRYGPCQNNWNVNQCYIDNNGQYQNYCRVMKEHDNEGYHWDGTCEEGPEDRACTTSQSFCEGNAQTVKAILPENDRTIQIDYSRGSTILAQLWQQIYFIFLNIYFYPFPEDTENKNRRGTRNPEYFSLVDPVQNDNVWGPGKVAWADGNNDSHYYGWYTAYIDGYGFQYWGVYYPVYPQYEKAKAGYKLVNDYFKVKQSECNHFIKRHINTLTEEQFYQMIGDNDNIVLWMYIGGKEQYWRYYNTVWKTSDGQQEIWGGSHTTQNYNNFKKVVNYKEVYPTVSTTTNKTEKGYFYTIDSNWDNNPYITDENCYEPLSSTESYYILTNPNTNDLPSYKQYTFPSKSQWYEDVKNHLIYILHNDFLNDFNTKKNDMILFELYKRVLELLDSQPASNEEAKETIVTEQIIQKIQNTINNYKINGDRCKSCNSHCNIGTCELNWQADYSDPCLYDKQYGAGGGGQVDTSVSNTDLVWCHTSAGGWKCVNKNT